MRAPQLEGGPQPVVLVIGRHLDVHDGDIRAMREPLPKQILGVARLGYDVEAGVHQQPRDPLAQQNVVLTDQNAQALGHGEQPYSLAGGCRELPAVLQKLEPTAREDRAWARSHARRSARRHRDSPRRGPPTSARPADAREAPTARVPVRCRRCRAARRPGAPHRASGSRAARAPSAAVPASPTTAIARTVERSPGEHAESSGRRR